MRPGTHNLVMVESVVNEMASKIDTLFASLMEEQGDHYLLMAAIGASVIHMARGGDPPMCGISESELYQSFLRCREPLMDESCCARYALLLLGFMLRDLPLSAGLRREEEG